MPEVRCICFCKMAHIDIIYLNIIILINFRINKSVMITELASYQYTYPVSAKQTGQLYLCQP